MTQTNILSATRRLRIIVHSANTARIHEVDTLVLHQWLEVIDAHEWQ